MMCTDVVCTLFCIEPCCLAIVQFMCPWQSQSTDTARVGNTAHCSVFYEADDECVSCSVLYGLCLKASMELPVVQG